MKKIILSFLFLLGGLSISLESFADTYINKTRIIINEADKDETFSLYNEGHVPALIQSWIDRGNEFTNPDNITVPFVILTPIFRVEPESSFNVRILPVKKYLLNMPTDRESLFWLNTLEIPPKGTEKLGYDSLQLAFRTRIKILYRPKNISSEKLSDSISKLKLSITEESGERKLKIVSSSPLFLTLISVSDKSGLVSQALPNDGIIIPFGEMLITSKRPIKVDDIKFQYVDDYGVIVKTE